MIRIRRRTHSFRQLKHLAKLYVDQLFGSSIRK
jgi:hypothetical protein